MSLDLMKDKATKKKKKKVGQLISWVWKNWVWRQSREEIKLYWSLWSNGYLLKEDNVLEEEVMKHKIICEYRIHVINFWQLWNIYLTFVSLLSVLWDLIKVSDFCRLHVCILCKFTLINGQMEGTHSDLVLPNSSLDGGWFEAYIRIMHTLI